jgi:YbbR-like protein
MTQSKTNKLKRVFSNLGYKLTALALSLLVWYVVQSEEILEVNAKLDVNIEVTGSSAVRDYEVISRDITLRGPRLLVGAYQGKSMPAIIRVPATKIGTLRYRLDKEFIPNFDSRIRLTIHDPYVSFVVEEKLTKSLLVKPTILGEVTGDVILDDVIPVPASIEVSGARSEVSKLTYLSTDPLDVSSLTSTKVVTLGIAKANLPTVTLSDYEVKVTLVVGPKKSIKTVSFIPVTVEGSVYSSSVRPLSISAMIRAPDGMIDQLGTKDFHAFIEAKDLVPGHYDLPLRTKGPDGVIIQEINPKTASVEIFNHKKRD